MGTGAPSGAPDKVSGNFGRTTPACCGSSTRRLAAAAVVFEAGLCDVASVVSDGLPRLAEPLETGGLVASVVLAGCGLVVSFAEPLVVVAVCDVALLEAVFGDDAEDVSAGLPSVALPVLAAALPEDVASTLVIISPNDGPALRVGADVTGALAVVAAALAYGLMLRTASIRRGIPSGTRFEQDPRHVGRDRSFLAMPRRRRLSHARRWR